MIVCPRLIVGEVLDLTGSNIAEAPAYAYCAVMLALRCQLLALCCHRRHACNNRPTLDRQQCPASRFVQSLPAPRRARPGRAGPPARLRPLEFALGCPALQTARAPGLVLGRQNLVSRVVRQLGNDIGGCCHVWTVRRSCQPENAIWHRRKAPCGLGRRKSSWTTGSGIDAAAIREIAALPSRRARSYTLLNDIGGSKCRCC